MGAIRFIGAEGHAALVANQTGVAVIDGDGQILDPGWTRGAGQAIGWADSAAETVKLSCSPARRSWSATCRASGVCQTQAGQRYGRWKVSAKTTDAHSPPAGGRAVPAPG